MITLLVAYDVDTTTRAGRRRLRRVAQTCLDYGQRVQYSVFECQVGDVEQVVFRQRLLDEIDPATDRLRLYRLPAHTIETVEVYGTDPKIDFGGPLIG